MPLVVKDRIKETSTTSGTGTLTLAGASAGFRSFADVGNGNTTYYAVVDSIAGTWEVGIGTYTSSGTTLSRTTILSNSSGTTAAINFAANSKDVFVTYPASKSLYYQDSGGVVIEDNGTTTALRITQTGTGNALLVEDSTNPDATPFVIDASGRLIVNNSAVISVPNYANNLTTPVLQILGTSGATGSTVQTIFTNSNYAVNNITGKSRGTTVGDYATVLDGDRLYSLTVQGADGTGFIRAAEIAAYVDGTPGTNDMPGRLVFSTTADGASTPTERMRIDSSGNVGIGTTNPTARLNVVDATTQDALRITQTGTGNALVVEDSTNPDSSPFVIDNGGLIITGATTNQAANLATGNARLQILGGTAPLAFFRDADSSTAINLEFAKRRATGGVLQSGDTIGRLYFSGNDGTAAIPAAFIDAAVDGTPGTNDMPGRLVFSTTADGAATPTERMRINSSGNVGIGVTPSGSYKLEVNGDVAGKEVAATNGIFINSNTVSESFTVPSNYNAMSSGSIIISTGVTVTLPTGSRWVVV